MKKRYLIIIGLLAIFAVSAFLYYTAETEIIDDGQGSLEETHPLLEVEPDPEPTGNDLNVLQTLTDDPTITIVDYVPMDDMAYDKVGIVCYTVQGDDTIYISYLTLEYESKVGLGASGELSLLSESQLVYVGNGVSEITLQSKETGEDVVYTVEFWLDGIEPHFEISSSDYVPDPQPITPDQLAYFNEIYFNETMGQNFNYANQFLHSPFASPADIDLHNLFYHGVGAEYTMYTLDERDAVAQAYGFSGWAEIPTDVTPIPRASMDDFLQTYTGTTLADSNKVGLDSFRYLETYDCYYNLHGDTNYYGDVEFVSGIQTGELIALNYYNSWQQADYVLTLIDDGDGNYMIYSNLPA